MKGLLIGMLILSIQNVCVATSAQSTRINLDYIKEFIKKPNIQNATDFITELPKDFKNKPEHVALADSPNGLIEADYDFPNVYLKGDKNSSVVIVYNSNPANVSKSETVEILSYDIIDGQPTHQLAEIVFSPDSAPKIEVNPASCIRCHGSPSRPLWVSGYDWDGFMSEEQEPNRVYPSTNGGYTRYLIKEHNYKKNPRLSFIDFTKYVEESPLISMSSRLAAEHSTVIATKLLRHPNYEHLKKELFSALSLCDEPLLKKNITLEKLLGEFGIRPEEWYMNTKLENDPSRKMPWAVNTGVRLGYATKRTAFDTGIGPIEFFIISHLIQNDSTLDSKVIKKLFSKTSEIRPFMRLRSDAYPRVLYNPKQQDYVGGAFGSQPTEKWCDKFQSVFSH